MDVRRITNENEKNKLPFLGIFHNVLRVSDWNIKSFKAEYYKMM